MAFTITVRDRGGDDTTGGGWAGSEPPASWAGSEVVTWTGSEAWHGSDENAAAGGGAGVPAAMLSPLDG